MNNNTFNLLLAGPSLLLLCLASLAALLLILTAAGRLTALTMLIARTATRRLQGRISPIVWGAAAELLIMALAAGLFRTKITGLLGLIVLLLGFAFAGLGTCLVARRAGRVLLVVVGDDEDDAMCALLLGLLLLFLSAFVPVIGWIVVLLAAAAGGGIVLETLLRYTDER